MPSAWSTASSPWPKARSAAGTGATSITSRCSARCPRITGSVWTSPSTRWPPSIRSSSCAEAAGRMSSFVTSMTAGTSSGARIRSKASSPTSNAATARPSPLRCAKSWRSTSALSPARNAAAPACAARLATCGLATRHCRRSRHCPSATPPIISADSRSAVVAAKSPTRSSRRSASVCSSWSMSVSTT